MDHDAPADMSTAHRPVLLAAAIALAVAGLALFARPPEPAHDTRSDAELAPLEHVPAYSPDALEALLEADQTARRQEHVDWERLRVADAERRQIVGAWLDAGAIQDGRGLWSAAMIFQHGRQVAHYARARELALAAVEEGYADARWLKAAAEDRWLLAQGKRQRYGTQFQEVDGEWVLAPVDPGVSDAERAKWDVPPLAESRQRAHDMNEPEGDR